MTAEESTVADDATDTKGQKNLPLGVVLTPTLFFVAFLTIWELVVRIRDIQVLLLPALFISI